MLGTIALTGCAAGPDFRSPLDAAPAQAPFVGTVSPVFTIEEPPGEWWQLYDDPALDGIIREALEANTDIRIAAANLARAQAALREARSDRLPVVTPSVSSTTGRQNIIGQNPPMSFEDTTYAADLQVSYQFNLFGRVTRAIEAANANAEAVQAAYDVTRITVAAETALAYADACAARLQLEVARNTAELQRRSYELTMRLLEAGRGTALDVARALAVLEQTRAEMPALEAARRAALFRLAILTGRPPAEIPEAAERCEQPPLIAGEIPVGDGARLLRRRPDLRQAERELAVATARIGIASAELYPTVTLGASRGAVALDAGDLDESSAARWSIGPFLSWSFPRVGARARVAAAEATADAALASFDGVWLEALGETESALSGYANELERVDALRNARAASDDAARLANARFDAGQISFLDVLQAQITLAQTEMAVAASQARLAEIQIALFLALGGAWDGT